MEYTIAPATLADAGGVLACLHAAFGPYRTQYTPHAFEDTVLTADTVKRRIGTMSVFVARNVAGEVIGTIGGAAHGDEGHIRGMAVLPDWQGRGLAERLLETVERALASAGCRFLTLDTTAPLARAIRFYERHGYRATGVVSDFFGMPLYQYVKRLDTGD